MLGFVDDVENPDEEARQAASELALGFVSLGLSSVLQMGHGSRVKVKFDRSEIPNGNIYRTTTSATALIMTVMVSSTTRLTLTLMVMDLRAVVPVVQVIVGAALRREY